tara:strand:- start:2708 stop:3001 length:294 start_codon:yes stop_codon:yes gene_type:complete
MLFLEGVIKEERGQTKFKRVKAPSHSDMEGLINTISHRIAQYLEKTGLIQRDMDNSTLDLPITTNTCRAPPVFEPVQTSAINDYSFRAIFRTHIQYM